MIRFNKKELARASAIIFETTMDVRFQDVDAAGIVFFARFFEYLHAVYEEFMAEAQCPLPDVLREKRWAAPLRHAESDYFSPARFGDKLRVRIVASHVDDSEITLGFRFDKIWDSESSVIAVAQTVHTFVNLPSFERRSVPRRVVERLGIEQIG